MKEQMRPSERLISRRKFLIGTASGAGGLIVGCGSEKSDIKNTPEPTPKILNLEKAIKDLRDSGISSSPTETFLWNDHTPFIEGNPNDNSPEASQKIRERFAKLVDKMRASENPYFKEAGNTINDLIVEDRLSVGVNTDTGKLPTMSTMPYFKDDDEKLDFTLNLYTNSLAKQEDMEVAFVLTHELKHMTNFNTLGQTLRAQGNSTNQIRESFSMIKRNSESCVQEEAYAYGAESRAYVHQRALMPTLNDLYYNEQAGRFVETGSDETNEVWKQLVSKNANGCLAN